MNLLPFLLNESLVAEEIAQFDWPVPYELEDDMPDGINVCFPRSNFFFMEGLEGRISVGFLKGDTKIKDMNLTIQDALEVLAPEVNTRATYDFFDIPGEKSEEKVRAGIKRCLGFIHEHLQGVVQGDFSWAPEARRRRRM